MSKFSVGDRVRINNFFDGNVHCGNEGVVIICYSNPERYYSVCVDLEYQKLSCKDKELDLVTEKEEELWV
jgi:hypothetical protein